MKSLPEIEANCNTPRPVISRHERLIAQLCGESGLLEAALKYAESGVPVFPCRPGEKKPITKNGFLNATTDPEIIAKWWTENPNYNIAFSPATCEWSVLDVEVDGIEAWKEMKAGKETPRTFTTKTPRGGLHYYFKGELPSRVRPYGKEIAIDTRGHGGYVLLPPSSVNGAVYTIVVEAEVAPLPDWLKVAIPEREKVAAPANVELDTPDNIRRATTYLTGLVTQGDVAVEGGGGDTRTFQVFCMLHDLGLSPEKSVELVAEIWNPECLPPWDDEDLEVKANNAARFTQNEAGAYAVPSSAELLKEALDKLPEPPQPTAGRDDKLHGPLITRTFEYPITRKGKPDTKDIQNLAFLLGALDIQVYYDDFNDRTMICRGHRGVEYDDARHNELYAQANMCGLRISKDDLASFVPVIARRDCRHEVRDYFRSLAWDGKQRLETMFMDYFKADDTRLNRAIGHTFMIALVRRVMHPGCKHDEMLVLEGKQGCGKSSALAIIGGKWHSDSFSLHQSAKELLEQTPGAILVEIAELSGLARSEIEHVKSQITRQKDKARLSYARFAIERPRQFLFVGTTNNDRYLNDSTGNRRFLPVKVGGIDLEALKRDRDQLFAEAVSLETAGHPTSLPKDLWELAASEQSKRVHHSPELERLEAYLGSYKNARIYTDDIWSLLGHHDAKLIHRSHGKRRAMGDAMRQLGWRFGKDTAEDPTTHTRRFYYEVSDGSGEIKLLEWNGHTIAPVSDVCW
jgi:hypothetical protein